MIVDNEEFYEQEKPLSLKDIRSLIILLRQVTFYYGLSTVVIKIVESFEIDLSSPLEKKIYWRVAEWNPPPPPLNIEQELHGYNY